MGSPFGPSASMLALWSTDASSSGQISTPTSSSTRSTNETWQDSETSSCRGTAPRLKKRHRHQHEFSTGLARRSQGRNQKKLMLSPLLLRANPLHNWVGSPRIMYQSLFY